jgi:hypothetical protein
MTGKAAGPTTKVPLATFQELAAQYHHRLLSLEVELKDQARSGGLSARAFASRVKRLKRAHKDLEKVSRHCMTEEPGKLTAADIGLPVMDQCTPAEHAVCEAYLIEKEANATRLAEETGRVYRWLNEAVSGQTGPLRLTLRLSRLRSLIQSLEKRSSTLGEAEAEMNSHLNKLLAKIKHAGGKEGGRSTIDGLMELFQQLDRTTSRVARLRALVKKEETRTQAMAAWLRKEEAAMAATRPSMATPTPLAISAATAAERAEQERQRRRKSLVAQFWDEVVHKGLSAPDDGDTLAVAAVAIKRQIEARGGTLAGATSGGNPINPFLPSPKHLPLRRRRKEAQP